MADLLLTIHVLAAVLWVGGSAALLTLGYYLRGRDINTRVEYTRWTEWLGPRLFAPMSIAVIVAGHLLVNEIGYDFDQTWLMLGQIGWLLSFLIGIGFYPREGKKREKLIEQHGIEHESVNASINRVLTVASIDTLIVVLVVVDMTTKPGL
ncbi:MAG TPA: DUF2269 family protein [Thermoleophilaceae bacterium]|nr:DUF2269 family protein [Thermoleophilaceae bacterium]